MHRMGIYVVTGQERVCGRDISRRQFHADAPLHRGGECSRMVSVPDMLAFADKAADNVKTNNSFFIFIRAGEVSDFGCKIRIFGSNGKMGV